MYTGYMLNSEDSSRDSGTIEITRGTAVSFISEKQTVELSLDSIAIEIGGTANRLVYFTSPTRPTITIVSTDKKVLKDPGLAGARDIASQVQKSKGHALKLRIEMVVGLILTILVIFGLWKGYDKAVDFTVSKIPQELEFSLGQELYKHLISQYDIIEDSSINAELNTLLEPLISAVNRPDIPFNFHIIEADYINAFAMPSGDIAFTTELILTTDTPEELLGVAAHEMAHITKRHSLKGIIKRAGIVIVIRSLFGNISTIPAIVSSQGQNLAILSNSRKHEFEADRIGYTYLKSAQISSEGLVTFFTKLQKETPSVMEHLSLLSTHPATKDRIVAIKKFQNDNFFTPKELQLSYNQFVKNIRRVTNSQNIEE